MFFTIFSKFSVWFVFYGSFVIIAKAALSVVDVRRRLFYGHVLTKRLFYLLHRLDACGGATAHGTLYWMFCIFAKTKK